LPRRRRAWWLLLLLCAPRHCLDTLLRLRARTVKPRCH
jgi:hypothetical protein